jgi:hypothetical protein
MIGTNSPIRLRAAFLMLALVACGLTLVWGCSETPFSSGRGDETPSYCAIPLPQGHKPDMATSTGFVEAIDYAALRMFVGGRWFFTDAETEIEIDDCKPCIFSAIQIGDPAKVKHDRFPSAGGDYYAREIEVEHEVDYPDNDDDDETQSEGFVEIVDGNRLLVSGVWFWLDGTTGIEIDDECADDTIIPGDFVKIEHSTIVNDGLGHYAYKIEVKRDCEEEEEDEEEKPELEVK